VIELHGSIWRRHCQDCGSSQPDEMIEMDGKLPRCSCGGLLRPSVVWFGENLPEEAFARARLLARTVRVLVVVGTSNLVYPAASIPLAALASGITVIEVNPEPTPLTSQGVLFRRGTAVEVLPTLGDEIEELLKEQGETAPQRRL
jgi:NAD-dependent deacetylase